jgi:hypothetical protein
LVGDFALAVDALGVDLQEHVHAVPGPFGDFGIVHVRSGRGAVGLSTGPFPRPACRTGIDRPLVRAPLAPPLDAVTEKVGGPARLVS